MTAVALAVRRIVLRTARSPLGPLWLALYRWLARAVARRVAPDESRAAVYLSGSLAAGEPLPGLSDIDLVLVAIDRAEAAAARERFAALCRRWPPLTGLIPHFWTYTVPELERMLRGPYPVLGEPAFTGLEVDADPMGLLERPEPAASWRRLRGRVAVPAAPAVDVRIGVWLELQNRWRYAFKVLDEPTGPHAARLASGLVSEAARLWLLLERGEAVSGRRAPLERALGLGDDGIDYALWLHERLHRSPRPDLGRILPSFVRLSARIADALDERCFAAGSTAVSLVGAEGVPLADWRALALGGEERLRLLDGDPGDPAVLRAAAAGPPVTVLRRGPLLVEPTREVWAAGRLRIIQCRTTDPVSFALLDGSDTARFPDVPGWSALDRARQAVAEQGAGRPFWAPEPDPLVAARAALFLESVEAGRPELLLGGVAVP